MVYKLYFNHESAGCAAHVRADPPEGNSVWLQHYSLLRQEGCRLMRSNSCGYTGPLLHRVLRHCWLQLLAVPPSVSKLTHS